MSSAIHISQARRILDNGQPVDLRFVKSNGQIVEAQECVSLRYDIYTGIRQIKFLKSHQIRSIRDCLIIGINEFDVFL